MSQMITFKRYIKVTFVKKKKKYRQQNKAIRRCSKSLIFLKVNEDNELKVKTFTNKIGKNLNS